MGGSTTPWSRQNHAAGLTGELTRAPGSTRNTGGSAGAGPAARRSRPLSPSRPCVVVWGKRKHQMVGWTGRQKDGAALDLSKSGWDLRQTSRGTPKGGVPGRHVYLARGTRRVGHVRLASDDTLQIEWEVVSTPAPCLDGPHRKRLGRSHA